MHNLQVFLFGRFCLRIAGQEMRELKASKAQELLSYLLLHHTRPHHREALAAMLWEDDMSNTQSRRYFRRVLWQLQSVLAAFGESPDSPILFIDEEWIQFNLQAPIWVDALFFEQTYKLVQDIPGHYLDSEQAHLLQQAVQVYQSDLLNGWYHEWCLFERERLQLILLDALDKLMLFAEVSGKYEAGIIYGIDILRRDKIREHTHCQLMRLFYLSGNRTAALCQYKQCAIILENELGIKPAQATEILRQQIEADQSIDDLFTRIQNITFSRSKNTFLFQKMYDELLQIHNILMTIQHRVENQMEVVETALKE